MSIGGKRSREQESTQDSEASWPMELYRERVKESRIRKIKLAAHEKAVVLPDAGLKGRETGEKLARTRKKKNRGTLHISKMRCTWKSDGREGSLAGGPLT